MEHGLTGWCWRRIPDTIPGMAVTVDLTKKTVTLGVGDLVAEPLAVDGRVAGVPRRTRVELGREAHVRHQRTQANAQPGYSSEQFVRYETTVDDFAVKIQGRIDGVYPGPVVEEVKSVALAPLLFGALEAGTYPHHVEQLRLYGFFVGARTGRLVFVNVVDGATRTLELPGPFDDCKKIIVDRVRALVAVARSREQTAAQRRQRKATLLFPHKKPRQHQDAMIAAVERAVAQGRHLLVNAPSGIGKTAAALFPVVQDALANDRRVFFVTAKNTQQAVAMETLRKLDGVSATQIRAREKMCIHSVYACREEFCPHLQMMALKLQRTGALERLLAQRLITPEMAMEAGRGCSLCPFELALLLAEQTDVIVCDYNYVFDPQVYFRRFFQDEDYSEAILVLDEAHNLVQRAMEYYSPVLRRRQVHDLAKNLRHVEPSLARDLRKWLGVLDDLFETLARRRGDEYSQVPEEEQQPGEKFLIESPRAHFTDLRATFNKLTVRYLLDKATSGRALPDDPVEEFFSAFGQFCSVLAMEGEEFSHVFDASPSQALQIVCKDPSRQLAERLDGFHSVIAMSATLAPMEFYQQMLGFDVKRTDEASFPSPFPRENRRILVVPNVLTTYRARGAHYGKIAEILVATASAKPGNYMALFPSYDFLHHVARQLPADGWELRLQEPHMTEADRQALLDALKSSVPPKLVLAVQGGLFAEGVDLSGEQLIGVIVVSPALPQVSFERELMRRYYDQRYGKGFEFAYLYPGMNRVIQSVGRLIRTETDRGVAVLVCQRFTQAQYTTLFPPDWAEVLEEVRTQGHLETALRAFWK